MTPENVQTEVDVMERLRVSGTQVASLKAQIAVLQKELEDEVAFVTSLYRQYSGQNSAVSETASTIISSTCAHTWGEPNEGKRYCLQCGSQKPDKRNDLNPIKNLNIGVNLSYRHSQKLMICNHCSSFVTDNIRKMYAHAEKDHIDVLGDEKMYRFFTPDEARERAYASIVETAIKKGIHTDDSTADAPKYVTSIQNLPRKVIEKIEQGYIEYSSSFPVVKQKKTKKVQAAG